MMSSEKIDTRTRILVAALGLLVDGKGSLVRMADIAKRAGISRQAVYLHFTTRADLLIAATKHVDDIKNIDGKLARSRKAKTGVERLDAFIDAWGNYIPEIYNIARALIAMSDADVEAAEAWENRTKAVREGCEAAVTALKLDGTLSPDYSISQATDVLWMLLSVQNWEQLTKESGWSQKRYIKEMKLITRKTLITKVSD